MKKISFFLMCAFAVLFTANQISAQDEKPELKVKLGGTIQGVASYSQTIPDEDENTNQIGFGLRRVRVKMYGNYGEHVKSFVQFELTSPKLLDARIEYVINKAFQIRMGRFIGAGVRAGGLTPHTNIDIVERAASAIYWGAKTIGADYRDYGLAVQGDIDGFNYNLTLHNGAGDLNIKAAQLNTATTKNRGIAVSGMVFYKPALLKGFEAGGYFGKGNSKINDYSSYNAYIYYEPLPFRVKAEVISATNKVPGTPDVTFLGWYAFGAYRVSQNFEALARFETLDMNTNIDNDKQTFITLGLAYSMFPSDWKAVKITGAYVIRNEEVGTVDNNVFYLMFQTAL